MKKQVTRIFSFLLITALLLCTVPFIGASAADATVGISIDNWVDGYLSEVEKWNIDSLSLVSDSNLTDGGKSLKVEYKSGGMVNYANGYWHEATEINGQTALRFWAYNPENTSMALVMRFSGDVYYSLGRSARYYIENTSNGYIYSCTTTWNNTSNWADYGFGEINLPAGFKGYVYIPIASFANQPTSVGKYRFDFFNSTGSGVFYYDNMVLTDTVPAANVISDFSTTPNIYYKDSLNADVVNEQLKLSFTNTSATVCMSGLNSFNSNSQYMKYWIKNTGSTVYISYRNDEHSIVKDTEYYLQNINSGTIYSYKTAQNIFPNVRGAYLSDITVPADFEGWVYIPLNSIKDKSGAIPETFLGYFRLDFKFTGDAGDIYIDDILTSNETLNADILITDFDGYTDEGYVKEIDKSASLVIATDTSVKASSKSLKFSVAENDVPYANLTNGDWVPNKEYTGKSGMAMWFSNPSDTDVYVVWRGGDSTAYSFKAGMPYYLWSADGKVEYKKLNSDVIKEDGRLANITVPAGFTGVVYVPFTSFFGMPNKIGVFRLDFKTVSGAAADIYIDDYRIVGDVPAANYSAEANSVSAKISALPEEITLENKETVNSIYSEYSSLDDVQKSFVENADVLLQAYEKILDLETLFGDANGDKVVDIRDLVRVKRYTVGEEIEIEFRAADLNKDGEINSTDIAALRKILLTQ